MDTDITFRAEFKPPLALIGATVIDGTGAPPFRDATIIVENGCITAVGPRSQVEVPDGAERRDLTGLTILPGFIDSHVHISFALPRGPDDPQAEARISEVLREFLRNGVTTIRDLGGAYPWIIGLSRSIEDGRREGPRILAAGPMLTSPGGHPAGTLLRGNQLAIDTSTRQLLSPEQARATVSDLAAGGVNVIKAVVDCRGRADSPERIPTLDTATLGAIVAEAGASSLPVTVHWGNVDELRSIVALRPTQLEHCRCEPIQTSVIDDIKRAGIVVDATLVIAEASAASAEQDFLGALQNVRRLREAGVSITAGTDAPLRNLPFGESLHRELELLVDAGLTPMEAIEAATSSPAKAMKRGDEIGAVQSGKRADLIAVAGDPLQNISDTRKIKFVIRDGRIVVNLHES